MLEFVARNFSSQAETAASRQTVFGLGACSHLTGR